MLKYLLIILLLPFSLSAKTKIKTADIIVSSPNEKYFGDDDVRPSLHKVFAKELREVEIYLNSFQTIITQFKQSNANGEVNYGKLFISKPGKIRCEYLKPLSVLIMNDKKITYHDQELDEVSYASSDINALKLLAINDIQFKSLNLVEAIKDEHSLSINIKEYSPELKQNIIVAFKFSYPHVQLKQISVITEDNEISMVFDKITYDKILGKQLFYLQRDIIRNRK